MTTQDEDVKKKAKEDEKREKAEEDGMTWGRKADFDERLQKSGMKLTLWCTRTFRPLTTHDEIEPIMETLGFVPLPLSPNPTTTTTNFNNITVVWKEYNYPSAYAISNRPGDFPFRPRLTLNTPPPTPRLPYPRIDGLHVATYRAFVDAIKFYHNEEFVSDHFHVRAVPVDPIHDQHLSWFCMVLKNHTLLYREGTLDVAPFKLYSARVSGHMEGEGFIEKDNYEDDDPKITVVSMDDIIVADQKREAFMKLHKQLLNHTY